MKRGEILAALRELQANSTNIRGWLDDVDAKIAALAERLKTPVETAPQPEPEPERFTVQPTDGRDAWTPPAADNFAQTLADLVTPKQLGMIRALGREAGVDWELECQQRMKCKAEELSKRGASTFIDHLKALQEQGADFRKAV